MMPDDLEGFTRSGWLAHAEGSGAPVPAQQHARGGGGGQRARCTGPPEVGGREAQGGDLDGLAGAVVGERCEPVAVGGAGGDGSGGGGPGGGGEGGGGHPGAGG